MRENMKLYILCDREFWYALIFFDQKLWLQSIGDGARVSHDTIVLSRKSQLLKKKQEFFMLCHDANMAQVFVYKLWQYKFLTVNNIQYDIEHI